jgi:hypothetical protein
MLIVTVVDSYIHRAGGKIFSIEFSGTMEEAISNALIDRDALTVMVNVLRG